MSSFVLVGGPFEIYDTPMSGESHLFRCTLGSVFEMSEDDGKKAVAEGAALLPKETFDAIGFTAEELKKYSNARLQAEAPAECQAKLLAARIALHNYRTGAAGTKEEV